MWLEEALRASEGAALKTTTARAAALKNQQARFPILADKGRKGAVTAFEGIRADRLEPAQRILLMSLVDGISATLRKK